VLALTHNIMKWRKNHFHQSFSVCGFNDVRQTEIRVAGPLGPESGTFEFEMTFENRESLE
jgi:hypothetical protein